MGTSKMPLREGVYYNSALSCLESPAGDIHLTPNEKKILEIILSKRGRKETIIDEIWHEQGIVVSESSYHQLVKMIRRKFVAAGMPSSCLKTIPRYGVVYQTQADDESENGTEYCDKSLKMSEDFQQAPGIVSAEKTPVVERRPAGHWLSLWSSSAIWLIFSLTILWGLRTHDTRDYFIPFKAVGEVSYHVAPATKVSQALWQRIERQVQPVTREAYVASNGPKVWVAYCEKSIYKDNAPCTYEHFSQY